MIISGPPRAAVVIQGPKLERPKVNFGVTLEKWNIFKRRWDVFVSGSGLDPDASSSQLFQCAGDSLLKTDPSIHEVADRHRSSHRCDASSGRSHAARA